MDVQTIVDEARLRSGNSVEPYLWIDAEWVKYLNEAQNEACRVGYLIRDSETSAICNIATVDGIRSYAYDSRIIKIITAKISTDTWYLQQITRDQLDNRYPNWLGTTVKTKPRYFTLGYQSGKITLYAKPGAVYTVNMTVYRNPTAQITTTTMSGQTPEIDSYYHPFLIDHMLYRAFLKPGAETYDRGKSTEHFQLWNKFLNQLKREKIAFEDNQGTIGLHKAFR